MTFALGAWLAVATVSIYVCRDDGGAPLYTDRPCRDGAEYVIEALSVVAAPALSTEERAVLERIGSRAASPRTRARDDAAARERDCRAARAAIEAVRAERRRGYRLKDMPALDAREREARERLEATCGPA
jgi:hypothetical protein